MKNLICCCCGNPARGQQWHNRDTGYGLCAKCAKWILRNTPLGPDNKDFISEYGFLDVHYMLKETN